MLQKTQKSLLFEKHMLVWKCKEQQGESELLQIHYKTALALVCDL